ncbi:uncharacterized protein LOC133475329 isoform X2 [Phyllopteryx taeniolatus]|uniref:uncharacterized protein LOC133475329 isoform X2 n=1 Tax=Phyllopteryx taeniolatus TaxID=161469 RepID=UPI002AD32835|nr:uncharacterized protein LOC133475329 isoform X2 [Phyllopteryx taeniolatus]
MRETLAVSLCVLTSASKGLPEPVEGRSFVYYIYLFTPREISGKWIFCVGTSDNQDYLDELETVSSSWIELSPVPDSENFTMTWTDRIAGNCSFDNVTSAFPSSSANVQSHYSTAEEIHAERYLKTCPDCLLLIDNMILKIPHSKPLKGRFFVLFTRSGRLDDAQLEVFKKQAACLKFSRDLHFGNGTDLCPEENQ